MPPQNSDQGVKPTKPGLRQRMKAKLITHRTKNSLVDHKPPTTQEPHPINDVDRDTTSPKSDPKLNVEETTLLTDLSARKCEGSSQKASADGVPTDQEPKSLWNEAFLSLSPAEHDQLRAVIGDDQVSIFGMPDFDALKADVLRRQNECEEKAWRVNIGDHVIIVRDLAAKSATWLQKLGDLAIPFAPTAASAPWGLIKGVLQIPIAYDENMLALLASLDDTLKVVYHGHLYEMLYTPDRIPSDVLSSLPSELLEVYKSALKLIAYTQKQITDGTIRHFIEAFINHDGAGGPVSDLKARHTDLSQAAQLCESYRSAGADERLIDALRRVNEPLVRFEQHCEAKFKEMEDGEMISTLNAISSIPYTSHHQRYQEERTDGTCEWILEDDGFCSWENSSSPGVFWLWGMPGVGKSFLTSKVIDHFQVALERTPNHEGLAFFYCSREKSQDERSKPLSVLQSFLRQLACYVNKPELIQMGLTEEVKRTRIVGGSFNREKCEGLLLKSFDLYPCTTLIIDALDECDADCRRDLIRFLSTIPARASRPVKIFISSRPDDDIKNAFSVGLNVGVHASMTEQDMRLFINEKLDIMEDNHSIKRMRGEISTRLFAKCDGMFQWANLQLEQLKLCTTRETIKARLDSLPVGLKKAYDEIFNQIQEDDSHGQLLVSRAVMWVMCVDRDVTSDLLLSAIRVDPTKAGLDVSDAIDEQELIHLCRHLLVIGKYGLWRVSHLSVTEYFEKHHWTIQEAHLWVGNSCLITLLRDKGLPEGDRNADVHREMDSEAAVLQPKPTEAQLSEDFEFYALHYWNFHMKALNGSSIAQISSATALLVRFFGSHTMGSIDYCRWVEEGINAEDFHKSNSSPTYKARVDMGLVNLAPFEYSDLNPPKFPMLGVCRMGIYTALGDWWADIGECLEHVNSKGKGLVQLAAEGNSLHICERLLHEGAPIDPQMPGASLLAAITHGNLDLFRLFRTSNRHDWESLVQHPSFGHKLCDMLIEGHYDILQLLCSDDMANVNMQIESPRCGSLLAAAALSNNELAVRCLIRGGANVNLLIENGKYGSALAVAAYTGALSIAKYLVQCGADVNLHLKTGEFGSAFIAAARGGSEDLVEYLLQAGADSKFIPDCGDYGSALIAATSFSHDLKIIKRLVESGADVNFRPHYGIWGSALAAAAWSGDLQMIKYLIDAGADSSLPLHCGLNGSALVAAIYSGGYANMATIKYLVESGADLNVSLHCGYYGSALLAAIGAGPDNLDITKYLVEAGADVNLPIGYGDCGSALLAAIKCTPNSLDITKYLIKAGAGVNTQPNTGNWGSPLIAAVELNDNGLDLVKCLVEAGADVNLKVYSGLFGSALGAAVFSAHSKARQSSSKVDLEVVKYLVQCGADVNLPLHCGEHKNVLAMASQLGNPDLMKYLAEVCEAH